jgi:hypothetical protein
MQKDLITEIMALRSSSIDELVKKYSELFPGKKPPTNNKIFLWKQIAYKLQEMACGGISNEAKMQIIDLIEKYDPINNKALRPQVVSAGKSVVSIPFMRDKRLPIPGTVIHKKYKGQDIHVKVLDKGFEYKDKYYRSLTAIAFELTGAHWNGFSFFNL